MNHISGRWRGTIAALAIGGAALLTLAGCASAGSNPAPASTTPATGSTSTGVSFNQQIHDTLPADIRSAKAIKVGVTLGDAPFMDKVGGAYKGIVPDLAAAVSTVLGVEFEYQEMPFPGLIPALQAGKIEMAWTSMFDNAEREKVIDMAAYARASMGIAVVKGNPKQIQDIADLCDTVAGTTQGTVQERALKKQKADCQSEGKDLTLNLYATQNDAYTQIQAGKLDAVMLTYTPMIYQAAHIAGGSALEAISWSSPAGYLAVGVSKDEEGLAKAVNMALLQIEASGDYAKILTAHGAEPDVLSEDLLTVNGATSGILK